MLDPLTRLVFTNAIYFNELSVTVLPPKPDSGLSMLEAAIQADGIQSTMEALSPARVDVSIPRFKFAEGVRNHLSPLWR